MSTHPPSEPTPALSHVDAQGRASMVDVGGKPPVRREAVATVRFCAAPETLDLVMAGNVPKGDALGVARIAGIQAAKRCDEWIPLCHTLPLDHVHVEFRRESPGIVQILASAATTARTGVEMEALTAAAAAALTLYDMTKAVDRSLQITDLHLVSKRKEGS